MNLQQRNMITSEEIYEDLCSKIENLDYMPGEAISENELCERYDTSRHMIRGAFAMLRQRRLLEVYPQRGSFVSLIDKKYISDIIYIRESIEQEALQLVIESGNVDETCDKMSANLELQKNNRKDKYPNEDFFRLDREFHTYYLEAAGHGDIMDMMSDSYIHFRRWRNLELRSMLRMDELIEQHENIIVNLRNKDRLAVRKSLHEHIDTIRLFNSVIEKTKNEYFYKR